MGRHAVQRSRTMISLLAAGSAAALVAGILSVNGSATADARRLSDNLVSNPDFESGNGGWNSQSPKAALSSAAGHNSRRAARLTAVADDANLLLNDSPNIVQAATKGTTYVGSVWVRTDSPKLKVSLRFREVSGSTLVGRAQSDIVLSDGGWQQIEGEYVSAGDGTQIAVQVFAIGAAKGISVSVDDVDVRKVLGGGSPEPTESASPDPTKSASPDPEPTKSATPDPTPTESTTPDPNPGTKGDTLFGASIYTTNGEGFEQALARSNSTYGGSGHRPRVLPQPAGGLAGQGRRHRRTHRGVVQGQSRRRS